MDLDLLAVQAGIQEIKGLLLFDSAAGKSHELAALPRIRVLPPPLAQ
jgi:hypothetical protein